MNSKRAHRRRRLLRRMTWGCVVGAALAWGPAASAAWPDRPVRLVVGFAPGGSDISGRIIAQKLSQLWGQPVVVDNRPGAGGNIGAASVARATPDGYTLLLFVNSYTINTNVYQNLSWDLLRDFEPIGRYATSPMVAVVNDAVPVKSFAELIAYAKANPGKLNFGSAGLGTAPHLVGEMLSHRLGLQMVHVPYKGSAPSVTALAAGEVQVSFGAASAFDAFIKSGKLRPLAVTTAKRSALLPGIPTIEESGVANVDADIWYGLLAPATTPSAIVRKMSEDLQTALRDPEVRTRLQGAGVEPAYLDSQQMGEQMKRDVARWREVANRINLKLE